MRKPTRKPNCADVARSLRELEKLFGKPPAEKDKSPGEGAFIGTAEIKLPANDTTKNGGAA